MTILLRLFLSTYTLVFIFDFMCLVTSILSSAPYFETALEASEAFLVLQKLMVRIMAISYRKNLSSVRMFCMISNPPIPFLPVYTMLDAIPKSPGYNHSPKTLNDASNYPFQGSGVNKPFPIGGGQGQDAKFSSQNMNAFGNYSMTNKHVRSLRERRVSLMAFDVIHIAALRTKADDLIILSQKLRLSLFPPSAQAFFRR